MNQQFTEDLQQCLDRHSLSVDDDATALLARYCELLWKWNQKINLTRHTDFETFVTRDVIDTLQLSAHLAEGTSLLDVGAGGGVPGIPLAILRPDLTVSLAESVGKKARVLETIVRKLRLKVDVHSKRAEDVLKKKRFDVLTVRAVASLRKLVFWFQRQHSAFDSMILVKGPRWVEEREEASGEGLMDGVECTVLDSYPIPGRDHDSVILQVRFTADA